MKKLWPLVLISGLILGGCTVPTAINIPGGNGDKTAETAATTTPAVKETSLKDLITQGKALRCTWKWQDDQSSYEGLMYVSGNKFRQEVKVNTTATTKETKMTTISDGEYVYVWNDAMGSKGIKMALNDSSKDDYSTQNGKVQWDTKYEYSCSPTIVVADDLALPSGVEFMDLNAQLKEVKQ